MAEGKIEGIKMTHDRKTGGGQNLFIVDKTIAQNSAARNIYLTKNALPPDVNPADVEVTLTISWKTLPGRAAD